MPTTHYHGTISGFCKKDDEKQKRSEVMYNLPIRINCRREMQQLHDYISFYDYGMLGNV